MLDKTTFSDDAQQLNAIIGSATDGIIIINQKGIIETANRAAAQLFGYSNKEMVGKNVSLLMPQPHKAQHDQYIENYFLTGIKKIIGIGREVEGQKKNGILFPLRLSISEVKLDNRVIFTGILHDLSKEKAQEEKIKKLNQSLKQRVEERTKELENVVKRLLATNKQLQREIQERKTIEKALIEREEKMRSALQKERELNELKTRFVSMASHEFRTPLSSILTSTELLEMYLASGRHEKCAKNIARVKNAVNHLTSILNEFLSFSKLESNSIKPNPSHFNFDEFIGQLIETLKGVLKRDQYIDYSGLNKHHTVYLDKLFMNHTLTNLLSNAIKYSAEGQVIFLKVKRENNKLVITVEDQGIGIPKEDQTHLFTRFFRAHNVENIQGTGLGLNIVKKYVELMNGEITFSSILGKGSIFTVQIPLET